MYKYVVVKSEYINGDRTRIGYGIAVVEEYDGRVSVLDSVSDICLDVKSVEGLAELCNRAELDPIHLHEVVSDFFGEI